jgi:hypothetical protein
VITALLNTRITSIVIKNMPPKKIPVKGVKGKQKAEAKAAEKVIKAKKVQAKRKLIHLTCSNREEIKEGEGSKGPQCSKARYVFFFRLLKRKKSSASSHPCRYESSRAD